jgi:hypothetical protein
MYKAVIPIVSGVAYVANPIPELVKGSRTPYREYTPDYKDLAPRSRDDAFAREIQKLTGVYDFQIRIFRALGSGKHWVGVSFWDNEEFEDYKQRNLVVTLQSGKSWGVAENKVLRWLSGSDKKGGHYDETGAGSIGFLRRVLEHIKWTISGARSVTPVAGRPLKPVRLKVGWGNDKRERAYAWLTRLGFTKVADAGDGDPAYILDIGEVMSNPVDLAGRHIPERYLAGLPPALQQQRIRELTESRDAYKRGDYSELPTDRAARKMGLVKQSKYTTEAKKRGIEWRGNAEDMAARVLRFYSGRAPAREVEAFAEALRASFAKGLAAWKSGGHRPGATAQNWAVARVNSLVVGGKTSWTADKKQFAVLPDAVRAKIESMRQKQNPIEVKVSGAPTGREVGSRHLRFFQSKAALDRIEAQGKDVIPNIRLVVDWNPAYEWKNRIERGTPGVVTLLASPHTVEGFHESVTDLFGDERRTRISPYTAHTILHRLGDRMMPDTRTYTGAYITSAAKREMAKIGYVTDRVEAAYEALRMALVWADHTLRHYPQHLRGKTVSTVSEWMPYVIDTKACREGWVDDGLQAMAELVPYRVLYKKGREHGVKLLSDLPFVPKLEAALTEYIDANLDMLKGYQLEI